MLREHYDSVVINFKISGSPIIKTGTFRWHPDRDIYLSDVSVTEDNNTTYIHGYKRKFNYYCDGIMSDDDFAEYVDKYCVYNSDWEDYHANFIQRLLGRKSGKNLKQRWYQERSIGKEMVYTFHGELVEVHES